jgi:hypothetical protein
MSDLERKISLLEWAIIALSFALAISLVAAHVTDTRQNDRLQAIEKKVGK